MGDYALDTDLESKTNQALGDSTWVVGGAAIVGGLLLVSYVLYMVDVWATERIDSLLLSHYGPELYQRYTTALQDKDVRRTEVPTSEEWSQEDILIRDYLMDQEEQYRSQHSSDFLASKRTDYQGQYYSGDNQFSPTPTFSPQMTGEQLGGYRTLPHSVSAFSPTAELLGLVRGAFSLLHNGR